MALLTAIGALFFSSARILVRCFTTDRDVAQYAVDCLRLVSLGYPFYAWGMIMEQAFNGAGDTWTPTKVNLLCYWMLQIPLAFWLSSDLGPRGVYLAICGAESVLAVVAVLLFRRGKWKEAKV